MRRVRGRIGTAVGLTLLVAWGCGGGGRPAVESSRTESTVNGTVKIRGKLASRGTVTFDPSNFERKDVSAQTAPIGKDGTYSVTTLIGENQVSVQTPETARDPDLGYNRQTYSVQSGSNTFAIELPPPES